MIPMKPHFIVGAILISLFPAISRAGYDSNVSGVVTEVLTYTFDSSILFKINPMPAVNNGCNTQYFVIATDANSDGRKANLARLLLAKLTGESVNIGYSGTVAGDCAGGWIKVHRVG